MMRKRIQHGFTLVELLVVIAIIAILVAILFPVFAAAQDKARMAACLSNARQIGLAAMMYVQDYDETFNSQATAFEQEQQGPGFWGPRYLTYIRWPFKLLPYVKNQEVFTCPSDQGEDWARNVAPSPGGGGVVPWRISYGPNAHLMWPTPAVSLARVSRPADKIFVGEALIPYAGAELWNCEYWRAANWFNRFPINNGWTFATMRTRVGSGSVTDDQMSRLTRHQLGNILIFCDGHAKWYRWNGVGNSRPTTSAQWRAMVDPLT